MNREIKVLPVTKIGVIQEHEQGLIVSVIGPDGVELGLLLPEPAVSELSGALIERPRPDRQTHSEPGSFSDEADFHVSNVEFLAPEAEKCVLRLSSEGGPGLTFRLGSRMMRRWRDMLTDQIVRHERRQRQ